LLVLSKTIPRPLGPLTFGAQTIWGDLGLETSAIRHLPTIGLGFAAFLAGLGVGLRIEISSVKTQSRTEIFFLIGFSVLLFTFFLNTNYFYRCMFFLFLVPYLFNIIHVRPINDFTRTVVFTIFVLLVISFWAESTPSLVQKTCWLLFKKNVWENVWLALSPFSLIGHVCMWGAMTLLLALGLRVVLTDFHPRGLTVGERI
jgi:hypothetical protein